MRSIDDTTSAEPFSWRPSAWLKAAGHRFSRPTLYNEIHAGRIEARKAGKNRERTSRACRGSSARRSVAPGASATG